MKSMLFAAGLGTRLKPYTLSMPKAMVPINNVPLLQYQITKLIQGGCNDIVINVHHFAEQIIDYLNNHPQKADIHISDEREKLLDTGGGIKYAKPLLGDEPFLAHNVDILSNINIDLLKAQHRNETLATMVVSNRETSRYLLFDNDNRLVGWTNKQTGEVKTPYNNLDINQCKHLAFAGIQMINNSIFEYMERWNGKFSIIDFYLSIADKVIIKGFEYPNLQLLDIGKPETLAQAHDFLINIGEK